VSQFYVPGPAQVWVGTGGILPTRIVFPGGGPNCTGANAVVTATNDKGGITATSITDPGKRFTKTPGALAVGGGWGFCHRGVAVGGKITGTQATPDLVASLKNKVNGQAGYSYRMSEDFAFEFAGWTDGGVSVDIGSPMVPFATDANVNMASDFMAQGKQGRVGLTFGRYNQDVIERMYSRCCGGEGIDSYPGITDGQTGVGLQSGALAQAQFLFFPLVILAPYASKPPKRFSYGDVDESGNARTGMPPGIHFPVATIDSHTEPFSWRARKVTMSVSCHWVSDKIAGSGMLYDYAVGCVGENPTPN